MGESKLNVRCRFCTETHRPRFLCDPANRVLGALLERGMSFNLPTVEFPELIYDLMPALGGQAGDALVQQIVVQAGMLPVAGVVRPVVVFTGRTPSGPLPRWIYPGEDQDMTNLANLVTEMTSMAVRRAAEARR